jgi:hypothetical protein
MTNFALLGSWDFLYQPVDWSPLPSRDEDASQRPALLSTPDPPEKRKLSEDLQSADLGVLASPKPKRHRVDDQNQTRGLDNDESPQPIQTSGNRWKCPTCSETFRGKYEAGRHIKYAARCTGTRTPCIYCGEPISRGQFSQNRHSKGDKCRKRQTKKAQRR